MNRTIVIGTRGSDLALWQANYTKAALENLGFKVELKVIKTRGDQIQHLSFDKMEGKGFFTKEIEDALLLAGGLTNNADFKKIIVLRHPKNTADTIANKVLDEYTLTVAPNLKSNNANFNLKLQTKDNRTLNTASLFFESAYLS